MAKNPFLLSSDTLSGYGLDLVFQTAKKLGFDGIDLALWKNFDAWNVNYVKDLVNKHDLPVKVVQLSDSVNSKEISQALELCNAVGADVISINSPHILDIRAYKFMTSSLSEIKKLYKNIDICIINPPKSSFLALPIPTYHFTNIVEIVKKYKNKIGLDISNIEEAVLEMQLLKKISNFAPYINVVYLSDKNKSGKGHLGLGEGILKLSSLLKKFKDADYKGYFSLKTEISKKDLADIEKVEILLKKSIRFFEENY